MVYPLNTKDGRALFKLFDQKATPDEGGRVWNLTLDGRSLRMEGPLEVSPGYAGMRVTGQEWVALARPDGEVVGFDGITGMFREDVERAERLLTQEEDARRKAWLEANPDYYEDDDD